MRATADGVVDDASLRLVWECRLYPEGATLQLSVEDAPPLRRLRFLEAPRLVPSLRSMGRGRESRWLSLGYCSAHSSSHLSRSAVRPIEPGGRRQEGWWGTAVSAGADRGVVIFPVASDRFVARFAIEHDVLSGYWHLEGKSADCGVGIVPDCVWISLQEERLVEALERAIAGSCVLQVAPAGWGSWEAFRLDIRDTALLAEGQRVAELARRRLARPLVQIDNGWEESVAPARPDTSWEPAPAFSHNLTVVVRQLQRQGHDVGLWLTPFVANEGSTLLRQHPEFLVCNADGAPHPIGGHRRAFCIDPTHPGSREWLLHTFRRLAATGISYVKCDFLRCLLAPEPDDSVDGLDTPRRYFGGVTRLEAYRTGLQLLREGFGPKVTIMACSAPLGPTMGRVDVARVGPDIQPTWESNRAGIRACAEAAAATMFLAGRAWITDVDYMVLPQDDVDPTFWASVVALSGGSSVVSVALGALGANDRRLVRLLWPPTGCAARPLDLFSHGPRPSRWWLPAREGGVGAGVLGLLNWDNTVSDFEVPLVMLGLTSPHHATYAWSGAYLGLATDALRITVPPRAAAIVSLAPLDARPHVVATNRHFTQGIFDLTWARWQDERCALEIQSAPGIAAAGLLSLALPDGWRLGPEVPAADSSGAWAGGEIKRVPWAAGQQTLVIAFEAADPREGS